MSYALRHFNIDETLDVPIAIRIDAIDGFIFGKADPTLNFPQISAIKS